MQYAIRLRRGQARASFVMDHGRCGPPGALGGRDARFNEVEIMMCSGELYRPPHTSKDQDIVLEAGDVIKVRTPGGGYGDPFKREPALVAQDVRRAYYDRNDAADEYGVVLTADDTVDMAATERRRALKNSFHRPPSLSPL
ncbi:MAG: hydantoinase B/oxoprolinase family protein [Alphaproteobacteria bacterium]|nr:hydantoinase B/oxoprolinase family protein [Alphaproteobacteria bacterium]MCW5743205.1 hydantoinase B/oxoprolinase family protein [Alphaproteobacteria bacterium]